MRLSRLTAKGFRGLSGDIEFNDSLTLLVGENNAGKSAVIDALRLLTAARSGNPWGRWVTPDDFTHDENGARSTDTIELTATFVDLTAGERGRMLTCLAPSIGEGAAQLKLVAQLDEIGRVRTAWYGGDSEQSGVESWAREAIQHTYLHALRDAAADLRPGRDNKLVRLLSALSPKDGQSRKDIETKVAEANAALEAIESVGKAKTEIQDRLTRIAGKTFAQKTSLKFADPRFDRIVAALRALAGDVVPLEITENGLGFNNLLYMATVLAAISTDVPDDGSHLLLVEEPEAHLHPQLQDLLLRYLRTEAGAGKQVVVSTHSPNFASGAGVERLTVLVRTGRTSATIARSPAKFGISAESLHHLERFLDVTKASLLFARGVLLVEGIAEQLLAPALAKQAGIDLNEAGVAVINVGGVSFAPFMDLFSETRLPYRCAVLTDGDPPATAEELAGGDPVVSATAAKLKEGENGAVHVFISKRTFEWDLAEAGNWESLLQALALVKPRVAKRLRDENPSEPSEKANKLLEAVEDVKGRFAQALAQVLADGRPVVVPEYFKQAVVWAASRGEGS